MKKINLFCLPFAGGSKYSYRQFEEHIPPFINIMPVEYPGRGSRMNEPLLANMNDLLDDLYNQIKDFIDPIDYAIYGHSMGGLVACLLARKILENNRKAPVHLIVTGTSGPSSKRDKIRHLMSKEEFLDEVRSLNGCPEEILQNDNLFNFIEPILRSDFRLTEKYTYTEQDPLDVPITVITGTQEYLPAEDIQLWQKETKHAVDFRRMPGDHFFIHTYPYEIVQIIAKKLIVHTKTYSLL